MNINTNGKKIVIKPVIKWSGSKRSQATEIMKYIPEQYETYYEPFVGGGSILYALSPQKAVCGDICEPLIKLWNEIKNNPYQLADEYCVRWERLQNEGADAYYSIRDHFNDTNNPYDLMFLSRTCINGLIRFNRDGMFNSPFHHKRPGINPESLKKIILDWSEHIKHVSFNACDYKKTTSEAKEGDFVYLDPPYFHTSGMYYGLNTIDFEDFFRFLKYLNDKGVKYMLSFDGKRGEKDRTVEIPSELYERHFLIPSGNSSFERIVKGEKKFVYESIYMNY